MKICKYVKTTKTKLCGYRKTTNAKLLVPNFQNPVNLDLSRSRDLTKKMKICGYLETTNTKLC